MRRSPLHHLNLQLGARFTDFGGWEMPLRYESTLAEHRAVREAAGLFDVTHLGRFELTGEGARDALAQLLCNDLDRIAPGRCQYTMILNEGGGIIDDLIVWWVARDRFWVMPNAANHERVMTTFAGERGTGVNDLRDKTAMLAFQGPHALEMLEAVVGSAPKRMSTLTTPWGGGELSMAGTGYTGEPGAEIVAEPSTAVALVGALVAAGAMPAGLGARDTLRLEAGLTLWGEDIDETTTPLEAGLEFAVSFEHDFTGKGALLDQGQSGLTRSLVGLVLNNPGVPRHGHALRTPSGGAGTVTSGNISPVLGRGIALGYLSPPPTDMEDFIEVDIRDNWVPARLKEPPFHK